MIALITLPLLALGAWLFKRGLWPARIGSTPHCRKCDYILTGIQADRCPECGGSIGGRNVRRGERRRKPRSTAIGLLLIVIPLALESVYLSSELRRIDWYRHRPAAWVINDLSELDDFGPRTKAWAELERRIGAGSLPAGQHDALVELALREQERGDFAINYMYPLVNFVWHEYTNGRLTDAQADHFFDTAMKVQLEVRQPTGAADRVPFRISSTGCRAVWSLFVYAKQLGIWVDGSKKSEWEKSQADSVGGWRTTSFLLDSLPPGSHRLRVDLEVTGCRDLIPGHAPDRVRTVQLTADFEVTRDEPPLKRTTLPDASRIKGTLFPFVYLNRTSPTPMTGTIDCNSWMDAAFDVFARVDGKEYPLGGVSYHLGGSCGFGTANPPPGDPKTVDLILRSSETVARQTVDVQEIWEGEIVLKNVRVGDRLWPGHPPTRVGIPPSGEMPFPATQPVSTENQ